ncbi:DUF2922 domain-containing protein [Bacillus sp. T33-2]|uniref:DUF2922 domain-containing protein n=1 Tax=Bacillus sp. T33-2 TaxID=2054168 RepID=UPI000C765A7F|nr:DUF2922 domain-containing protein [Bacillus sp. T33-2]PLR95899.1 DUF2922 domain-containing protein [Bacillus sp. T33-2]
MARVLELNFVTDLGKPARLTVDSPKEPIDPAVVKLAMEQIIASNAFSSTNGNLAAVGKARVVERNVTEYELV